MTSSFVVLKIVGQFLHCLFTLKLQYLCLWANFFPAFVRRDSFLGSFVTLSVWLCHLRTFYQHSPTSLSTTVCLLSNSQWKAITTHGYSLPSKSFNKCRANIGCFFWTHQRNYCMCILLLSLTSIDFGNLGCCSLHP